MARPTHSESPPGQRREQVYRFVRQQLLQGEPPTVRDVQHAMGFRAVEPARRHLAALVQEGRLIKLAGRARGYRLADHPQHGSEQNGTEQHSHTQHSHTQYSDSQHGGAPPVMVPLVGRVQAGDLALAVESPDGYVAVQTHLPGNELFALTVKGQSMIGAGILPKDIVIVRQQPTAENGDIVVALVGSEATVKKLYIRRNRIELRPANPKYKPIIPDPAELQILGKVVELRRYLD